MRCEAVGKRYGTGDWVLREVDLNVAAGDVLAVIGGNGSGKSTLLRILAGLTRPTTGSVSGRPSSIGYVPDRFTAPERLSAASYLTHMGRVRGLSTATARARAHRLTDRLDLVGGVDASLRTLSKGNAQKVALAQALLVDPDLLVLDEPWSGLDTSAHEVLGELVEEVAARGGAVVFTDHREAIAGAHATGSYAIAAGRVTSSGQQDTAHSATLADLTLALTARPSGPSPDDMRWDTVPGVVAVSRRDDALALRVAREHSDAVLMLALRHHWSVDAVSPAESGPRRPSDPTAPDLLPGRPLATGIQSPQLPTGRTERTTT
ncbi:ATP-binding cassette domain-containing protein [Streptomyces uncialis]|uniref:ATP-binding cassette domain-containing protein n=1 Tax=Streptomyces uncialis TaxID=1048205 RepID=UPI0038642F4D|nr:ABC transporter ATP-binding protein [Streptomyces uncialis]